MAASRRLYADLAESIRIDLARAELVYRFGIAKMVRETIAPALKRDNSGFRYDTFFKACGLDESGNLVRA